MKIYTRLFLMFMVSFIGMLGMYLTSYFIVNKIKVNGPIYEQIINGKDIIADILPPPEYILESLLVVYSAETATNPEEQKQLLEQFKKLKRAYDERHDFWKSHLAEDDIKRTLIVDSYEPAARFYDQALNQYFPLLLEGKHEQAEAIFKKDLLPAYNTHREQIDHLVKLTDARNRDIENQTAQTIDSSIETLAMIAVVISLLSMAISWVVSRSITRPIATCMQAARQLARGDMQVNLSSSGQTDEIGMLQAAMQSMADTIRVMATDAELLSNAAREGLLTTRADVSRHQGDFHRIIQGFNDALDSLITPLNHIGTAIQAVGNNDLSITLAGEYRGYFSHIKESFDVALANINGTLLKIAQEVEQVVATAEKLNSLSQSLASISQEQASSVEEVTASVAETDCQIKANTDSARTANQVVIATAEAAEQGNTKMETMMGAMNSIHHSSQNIAKIIKVIDEIAFQTNLLALNAAVEAARAGQHGRGFAVVAMEVRNLAGRSAKAARETADMIDNSTLRVQEGVSVAQETREALSRIVNNVVKVKDLVGEITAASSEQSLGISQINVAINEVSNAALLSSNQAETMASASSLLTHVTNQILMDVSRFKLRARPANSGGPHKEAGDSGIISPPVRSIAASADVPPPAPGYVRAKTLSAARPREVLPLDQDERGFSDF